MLSENDWLEEVEELDIDFNSLRRKHIKSGYREGVITGQEYILQNAFNAGFKKSSSYHEKLAQYRGCLSAAMMFLSMEENCPQNIVENIEETILKLEKMEENEIHIDTMVQDRALDTHLNSKLSMFVNNEKVKERNIDNSMVEELAGAMSHTYTTEKLGTGEPMEQQSSNNGDKTFSGDKNLCTFDEHYRSVEASNSCRTGNCDLANNISKSERLLKETIVSMLEIVLDALSVSDNSFNPFILKRIKNTLMGF